MKAIVAIVANARVFSVSLFALAAIATLTVIVSILLTPALVAAVAALGILGFAFSDYSRKPSFRVRRNASLSCPRAESSEISSLDWTYTSRVA